MLLVLRLGHRISRDERVTTHVALVARALGAGGVILSGEKDGGVLAAVRKVCEKWGGKGFRITYERDWKKILRGWKGKTVHLTMYGIPIQEKIREIRRARNLLVVVGSAKVPGEVYRMCDYNIAITNQPHSEVGALAVFLHEYFKGEELEREFPGGRIKIEPAQSGKKVAEKFPRVPLGKRGGVLEKRGI